MAASHAGPYLERPTHAAVVYAVGVSLVLHLLLFAWLSGVEMEPPQSTALVPLTAELMRHAESAAELPPRQTGAKTPPSKPAPRLQRKAPTQAQTQTQAQAQAQAPQDLAEPTAVAQSAMPAADTGEAADSGSVSQSTPGSSSPAADSSKVKEPLDMALVGRYRMALICALKRHRSYPEYAQKREWSGRVRMRAEFAEDGRLQNVVVLRSSGHQILDDGAMETVRRAQADMPVPARLLGYSFSVEQEIDYQFDTQPPVEAPVSCPSL